MTSRRRELIPGLGQVGSYPSAEQLDFSARGVLSLGSEMGTKTNGGNAEQ